MPSTLEGRVIRFADKIAYINHDIDDAVRGGVISENDIPKEFSKVLGKTHSARIDAMIKGIIRASDNQSDMYRRWVCNSYLLTMQGFICHRRCRKAGTC
jgi:dGTPase